MSIKELIAEVVAARQQVVALVEQKRASAKKWEEENAGLLSSLLAAVDVAVAAERSLRDAALVDFMATGNKHLAPGVEVKWDLDLEWAVALADDLEAE